MWTGSTASAYPVLDIEIWNCTLMIPTIVELPRDHEMEGACDDLVYDGLCAICTTNMRYDR